MNNIFLNPVPTVDIIVKVDIKKIVLIKRANFPIEWALPGGFVEYGESYEECAIREALEETCLSVNLKEQFYTYSNPSRDCRQHTATTVFIATSKGIPKPSSDAKKIGIFPLHDLPPKLAFDHRQILDDYSDYAEGIDKNIIFDKYLNFTNKQEKQKS